MSFNMKDMTQGGQLFTMRLRMFGQIMGQIVWVLTILFLSVVAILLYFDVSKQNFLNGMKYWWCWTTRSLPSRGPLGKRKTSHVKAVFCTTRHCK